jgi:hypothetical protein
MHELNSNVTFILFRNVTSRFSLSYLRSWYRLAQSTAVSLYANALSSSCTAIPASPCTLRFAQEDCMPLVKFTIRLNSAAQLARTPHFQALLFWELPVRSAKWAVLEQFRSWRCVYVCVCVKRRSIQKDVRAYASTSPRPRGKSLAYISINKTFSAIVQNTAIHARQRVFLSIEFKLLQVQVFFYFLLNHKHCNYRR